MVSAYRFPYPDNPSFEVVVVAYPHLDKNYLQYHKHVIAEDGSHRIPSGLHTEGDTAFMIKCRTTVAAKLKEQGLVVEC